MKQFLSILFLSSALFSIGQQDRMSKKWFNSLLNNPGIYEQNFKDSLAYYNFESIWMKTDNQFVMGFIGDSFERLRMKLTSVKQDSSDFKTYHVVGKSMVKNNICDFKGTIVIERIAVNRELNIEYRSSGIKQQGFLIAKYQFMEDSTQKHVGIFEGSLTSLWYLDDSNQVQYDDVILGADAFRNNQFVGTWSSYSKDVHKVCNWGDYRISNCAGLDIGAGLFSPSDAYLKSGWQGYRDAYFNHSDSDYAREKSSWWK